MGKYAKLILILGLPLLFSGCSLLPSDNAKKDAETGKKKSNDSLWESIDGGRTWEARLKPGGKVNLGGLDILSLAVNPHDEQNVYAGLRGAGILKTNDSGETWEYLPFQSEKIYGLDFDPVDGKIIYASGVWQGRGKIFKSFDSGFQWEEIYTAPADGPLIIALKVDRKNGSIVYVATSDNQVLKSMDGGKSWKNIFSAPAPVIKIAIDNFNSSFVYLLMQGRGIMRSKNSGQDFEDISRQVFQSAGGNYNINVLEADPSNSGKVYLAGNAGILFSKDGGGSWEKIETLNDSKKFPVRALAVNPSNPREIIYGSAQAVYRSSDEGVNWVTSQFETSRNINVIKYAPSNPGKLYLGLSK